MHDVVLGPWTWVEIFGAIRTIRMALFNGYTAALVGGFVLGWSVGKWGLRG